MNGKCGNEMNKWKLGKKKFLGISLWEAWMGHFLFSSIPRNQMGFFLGHHELGMRKLFWVYQPRMWPPKIEGNIGAVPGCCECEWLYTWTTPRAVPHCRRRPQCPRATWPTLVEQSSSAFVELECNSHCSTRLPELRCVSLLHKEIPRCPGC